MTGHTDTDAESVTTGRTDTEGAIGQADHEGVLGRADADRTDGAATDAEYHAARAALYGLLGGVFCYPEDDLLAEMTAPEARAGVEDAAARLGFAEEAADLLDALDEAELDSLQSAYNGLFDLPDGGEYPVVPYEAHYTTGSEVSEEQRRIAAVVGLMEQFGVEPGDSFDDRQDHVAAELELMQVITAQRAAAIYDGDRSAAETLAEAEGTILDRHLIGFVPSFAYKVQQMTDDGVYVAAATLAERLVRQDHAACPEVEHDG